MNHSNTRSRGKRLISAFVCSVFAGQVALSGLFGARSASAADARAMDVRAVGKDEVVLDDSMAAYSLKKSNVLFLIEATDVMSFSPKGFPPRVVRITKWPDSFREGLDHEETESVYGHTLKDINDRMKEATFGMGALPPAFYGKDLPPERNLYGRDIDLKNNYVKKSNDPLEDVALNGGNYYAPFVTGDNPLSLSYRNQKTMLQTGFLSAPKVYGDGDLDLVKRYQGTEELNYAYNRLPEGKALPYALIFKNPAYWEKGYPGLSVGSAAPSEELTPNDSRMYQTKLVLWRLLQDPTIFQNLRIGLATTFLSPANVSARPDIHSGLNNRTDHNGIFKVRPWGSNLHAQRFFYVGGGYVPGDADKYLPANNFYRKTGTVPPGAKKIDNRPAEARPFSNGILTSTSTGHSRRWNGLHSQVYPIWHNSDVGAIYNPYNTGDEFDDQDGAGDAADKGRDKQRKLWKTLNRASLHVPIRGFDEEWRNKGVKMTHAEKFRMWIDGFADLHSGGGVEYHEGIAKGTDAAGRNNQFHFYRNPEIGIAGHYTLPMAIFPDPRPHYQLSREHYYSNSWVWFSSASENVNYRARYLLQGTEFQRAGIPKAFFNAGSGEAAGSVLDFFSPKTSFAVTAVNTINDYTQNISHSLTQKDLADVSFPIRSTCEDNWVIVIASGVEPKSEYKGQYEYHAWDAIRNLYNHTKKEPVTMLLRDAQGRPLGGNGKYAGENSAGRALVQAKLDNPIRTLVIGISAKPESITGDSALRKEVETARENLTRMARAGLGDDPNDRNSPYTPFFADDVETLQAAIEDALRFIDTHQVQPLKGPIMESRAIGDAGSTESFNYYSLTYRVRGGNQWEGYLTRFSVSEDKKGFPVTTKRWELSEKIARSRGSRDLRRWKKGVLVKVSPNKDLRDLSGFDADRMAAAGAMQANSFKSYAPERALFDWLNGYDHSYAKGVNYERLSMLADAGQGGAAFVDGPASGDSLPGYAEWARTYPPQKPVIYTQTNDGILHLVDPSTGEEEMAVLPPPVLVPSRMASLKARHTSDGRLQWRDVNGRENRAKSHDILTPRSNPLFLLDGALQRMYVSNRDGTIWKTCLLAGLGMGGSGLYMLDVDDHDDPKLMWYRERVGERVLEMSANQDAPAASPRPDPYWMKLGFNPPKAAMGAVGRPGDIKNIIVVSGGAQNKFDILRNGREGAVLLILDPETGDLIKGFGDADVLNGLGKNASGGSAAPNMGMMVSEPLLLRSDGSKYIAGQIYAADNRGSIFNVALESGGGGGPAAPLPVQSWNIRTVATLQPSKAAAAVSPGCYSIPHGIAAYILGRDVWLAGGTSDVRIKKSAGAPEDGVMRNSDQVIFSFRSEKGQTEVYTRGDLKELNPNKSGDVLMPSDNKRGWYFNLTGDGNINKTESVSAKPLIVNGVLFASTFIPHKVEWSSQALCAAGTRVYGQSRLYAVNVMTGAPYWRDRKYSQLDGAKITGITLSSKGGKAQIVVTYDNLTNGDVNSGIPDSVHLKDMSSFVIMAPEGNAGFNLDKNRNVIQYWISK